MARLQLKSKEDIRLAIRKRGREIAEKMTDAEFFGSAEFSSYVTRLLDFILRKHKLYSLELRHEPDNENFTAYTDGKMIAVNTGNSQVRTPKLLERRFKVAMGAAFHEAAHKLFLDFDLDSRAKKSILSGKLFGSFPTNGDPVLEQAKQELTDVVSTPYAQALTAIYSSLANFIYDGHDEYAMKRCFPGFIADCITVKNEVQLELTPTVEQMIADRTESLSIRMALLLEYAKYGIYKYDALTPEVEAHLQAVSELEPTLDSAMQTDNSKERWNWLNLLVLQLWPLLRELFPKNPNPSSGSGNPQPGQGGSQGGSGGPQNGQGGQGQQSQGGSGNGQQQASGGAGGQQQGQDDEQNTPPTPEEIAQAISNLTKEVEKALQQAPAPQNGSGKSVDPNVIQNPLQGPGSGSDAGTLASQIAQGAAVSQVQAELNKAQMEAIRGMNQPLIHSGETLHTIRNNPSNEQLYKRILKDIAPYLRSLVKEMGDLLRDLNDECVQHHLKFGPIIEAKEAYRVDNTFFAKKKLPEDLPNMSICVLIDQSGSMSGRKLECARQTAILLEQFAFELGIPIMIAGHDAGSNVNMRIFTDYLSAKTTEDRYSLAGIAAGGCNRDGLPIRVCADLLAQRQEDVRLMIVISDGAPNHHGYSGESAMKDISDTVKEYRRKGLLIYGAAIDDDKEIIESIYGSGFLSIQNLASLPKTLVRLIRQQMI